MTLPNCTIYPNRCVNHYYLPCHHFRLEGDLQFGGNGNDLPIVTIGGAAPQAAPQNENRIIKSSGIVPDIEMPEVIALPLVRNQNTKIWNPGHRRTP